MLTPKGTPKRETRGGWYRKYPKNVRRGLWRLVAEAAGVPLTVVRCVVEELECAACEARKQGWIGDFDVAECAVDIGVPVEKVIAVLRELMDKDWLVQEHIAGWTIDNPDQEDQTATERQRNRRAKQKAIRAVQMGMATEEQKAMLSVHELASLERLANLARKAPPPRPVEIVVLFTAVDDPAQNEKNARRWLFGDGVSMDYGPGSKIVADKLGMTRLSADGSMRRWLQNLGDTVALATIISDAEEQALNGEHFRNVVAQRLESAVREQTHGRALPFGPAVVKGGRSA